jgi:HD superfamily phosphohydrolase YqeK
MSKAMLDYHPVLLPTHIPEGKLPFDIYVNYKGQYLCFRQANTSVDDEIWLKLKKQQITQVFVQNDAFKSYQRYMKSLLDLAISSKSDLSGEERAGFMTLAAVSSVRSMAENPNDKIAFVQTRQLSGGLIDLLRKDPVLLESMIKMDLKEDLLFLHSKNVAALSIGLATKAKVKPETIEYLALAGLLHDVGIAHMPKEQRDLFYKPPGEVTNDAYTRYLKHGKNLELVFDNTDFIPKPVSELISNHEHDLTTNGKLNILVQILSMADKFDKMATIYGQGPKTAYDNIKKDFIGRYDLTLIKLLGVVLTEGKLI